MAQFLDDIMQMLSGGTPKAAPDATLKTVLPRGPELRAYHPTFSEGVGSFIQDILMSAGADPYKSGHVAHGVRDILGFTPAGVPMALGDLAHAKMQNDPKSGVFAAMGLIPGAKPVGQAAKKIFFETVFEPNGLAKIVDNKTGKVHAHGLFPGEVSHTLKLLNAQQSKTIPQIQDKTEHALQSIAHVLDNPTGTVMKPYVEKEIGGSGWHVFGHKGQWIDTMPNKEKADSFAAKWHESWPEGSPFPINNPAGAPKPAIPQTGHPIEEIDKTKSWIHPEDMVFAEGKWWQKKGLPSTNQAAGASEKFNQPDLKPAAKAPIYDYQKDDTGLYHIFDAMSGQTKKVVDKESQAMAWINEQKAAGMGLKKVPITQGESIDLPKSDWSRPLPAMPPWLNPGAVLPEDAREAARIAGGYTTPAVRGIRIREGEDFNPVHHGYNSPFLGNSHYSSASPELADLYAGYLNKWPGQQPAQHAFPEGAAGVPLWLNTKDYHVADAKGAKWTDFNAAAMKEAAEAGKPGVVIHNVWDEPNSTKALASPQTIYITFPKGVSTIKSKFAAMFDPSTPDISKALPFGIGAGGLATLMGSEDASAAKAQQPQRQVSPTLQKQIDDIMSAFAFQDEWRQGMKLPLENYADRRRNGN